jgi:hypothetical protein
MVALQSEGSNDLQPRRIYEAAWQALLASLQRNSEYLMNDIEIKVCTYSFPRWHRTSNENTVQKAVNRYWRSKHG